MHRIYYLGPEDDHAINDGDVAPALFECRKSGAPADPGVLPNRSSGEATTKSGRLIKFQMGADAPHPYALVTAEEGAEMVAQSTLYAWAHGVPEAPEAPATVKRGKAAKEA